MDDVFLKLVNLSISASWLILAVLVLRFVLKKAPKWVMPLLWGVVALRLVCLFSIESALSLIPSAETIPSEIVTETREPVLYEQATLDIVTNPTLPSAAEVPVGVSRQQAQVDFNIYSVLWLAGMAALLVHALVSAGKLKRKLATAILLRDNIYESEFVDSPFVFGVVKPNIYLPMHMDEGTAAHVIAHERAHLARRDRWCGSPTSSSAATSSSRAMKKSSRGWTVRHAQTIHRRYYPAPRRKEPSRPARWHSARGTSKRA